ncbi:MAG: VirB3 family type IV secretion system protein [Halothiobacillaceae bacterium]|nr:VirB3 family type IV secretion system protein [Halothiobacillaceae bacterium]
MSEGTGKKGYITYNGMARTSMPMGVPYMALMSLLSVGAMSSMLAGNIFGPVGWLVGLLVVPILFFIKTISATDDKAMRLLWLEVVWAARKLFFGNSSFYGGAMAIAPISYKRKYKDVKRAFKAATGRTGLSS